jgi:hypothetical protein
VMMMLGKSNWWVPDRLDRVLPKVSVDADDLVANSTLAEPDREVEMV